MREHKQQSKHAHGASLNETDSSLLEMVTSLNNAFAKCEEVKKSNQKTPANADLAMRKMGQVTKPNE